MMNYNNELEYYEKFGCKLSYDCVTWTLHLITPEKKAYSVDGATDEELDTLMKESIDTGENVLLEKFKDKEIAPIEVKPGCDY